ncbi:hypothetical protein COY95_03060, partial [Candidatus Woesearchaeota archaeon CG_4_10_14_0_8_um_filter_47_5]
THIFGPDYSFIGVGSKPFIIHKTLLKVKEWECRELDMLILSRVPGGDHQKAEELLKKYNPRYRPAEKNKL